jgi:hypothetical protein
MAAMKDTTVTMVLACKECGEGVELQQRIEFETLEILGLEDDKVRMLYKVKSSLATEVHLCTGEKPVKKLAGEEITVGGVYPSEKWQTFTTNDAKMVMATGGAVETRQPEQKKKMLLIAPTYAKAETFLRINAERLEGWDVRVHSWSERATRLRGMQFHLAVSVGGGWPMEVYNEALVCTRLGEHPQFHVVNDEKTEINPDVIVSRPKFDR